MKYNKTKNQLLYNLLNSLSTNSPEEQDLVSYLKNNYRKISYMSLERFSSEININQNLIINYLHSNGFKDYEDLRKAIRKIITVELSSTDRFKVSMEIHPNTNDICNHVIKKEIDNLNNFLNNINEQALTNIIDEILNSSEVVIVSTRASATIGIYAEHTFNRIGKKTNKIISGGTENFNFLSTIDRNALVIAFGFARYPKDTIKILSFLKKRNFKIISITDSLTSPLIPFSDLILTIPCESVSFTDSFSVPISLVNIISIAISQFDKEKSIKYLNEFEEIAKDMGFYF